MPWSLQPGLGRLLPPVRPGCPPPGLTLCPLLGPSPAAPAAAPSGPTTCCLALGPALGWRLLFKPRALKGVLCHRPCLGPRTSQDRAGGGGPCGAGWCALSPQTERLTAAQITEYKGVFEMFDEEGNGEVKTAELERLMSLLGINPTKSELTSMAKDVDRDSEPNRGARGAVCEREGLCPALTGDTPPRAPCRQRLLQLRQLPGPDGDLLGEGPEPGGRAAGGVPCLRQGGQGLHRLGHPQVGPGGRGGRGQVPPGAAHRGGRGSRRYVLMNAGEPLNEVEAEQMMKEADKDGDGTIDYEGERGWSLGARHPARRGCRPALCFQSSWP